jgi:phospholipid/cholesterol/gamma-HCH transport system permease protein
MGESRLKDLVSELQDFYLLSFRGLLGLIRRPLYLKDAIDQIYYAGAGSLLIILLISLFIGMALSLQLSAELSKVGLKIYADRSWLP